MYTLKIRSITLIIVLSVLFVLFGGVLTTSSMGLAQSPSATVPVDLMLIIDNSCSMYEVGNSVCGNNALGSDPDYLRVMGASLFAASMDFSEAQPVDRIGAIHMGTTANLIYPLLPIEQSREALARAVADPVPMGGTQVMEALREAYAVLKAESGSGNRPAIAFLTDGVPYPAEGQSFADIETLVKENTDVPIYLLLLQNQGAEVPQDEVRRYNAYIGKWQQFAQRVENVKVYIIPDHDNLLDTYHDVINDLEAQPPSPPPSTLQSGQSQDFYVSRYARRVYITAIQLDPQSRGDIEITDKSGQIVQDGEGGVRIFRREANPVEVYLAYGPRLTGQTDGMWNVRALNAALSVFIDVQGAYVFNWLSPKAVLNDLLPGTLILREPVNPLSDLELTFNLLIDQDQPIVEPQVISGDLLAPDGTTYPVRIPADFAPDAQGIYRLPFRLADYGSNSTMGRFELSLRSDDPQQTGSVQQSIAMIRVWIEADPDAPVTTVVATPKPVQTATVSPTLPVTPIPQPPTPCPNPPFCKTTGQLVGIGLLFVLGGAAAIYAFLRLVRKPPEGFVLVYENNAPRGGKISLKAKASHKFWQWWQVTVGPKGDIRVTPDMTSAASNGASSSTSDSPPVKIPGMKDMTPAPAARRGHSKKSRGKHKQRGNILGMFVYKDGRTRFINKAGRGRQKLDETVQSVALGSNVNLQMSSDEKKLNSKVI